MHGRLGCIGVCTYIHILVHVHIIDVVVLLMLLRPRSPQYMTVCRPKVGNVALMTQVMYVNT